MTGTEGVSGGGQRMSTFSKVHTKETGPNSMLVQETAKGKSVHKTHVIVLRHGTDPVRPRHTGVDADLLSQSCCPSLSLTVASRLVVP
jgi:hypothetical protein